MTGREDEIEFSRGVLAVLRKHAEELRAKGLPIDDMIRDLEEKLEAVRVAEAKQRDLMIQDDLLTRKREHLRKSIDGMTASLPPDLLDGMGTSLYLKGAVEREAERRRRGRKRLGG